ncbi:GNAT family N-acetyltransferase [bacterium]|nr:GNAT family N-acetyltransferase [bacterium]
MIIKQAKVSDIPTILGFIKELSVFEKLEHEVVASEEALAESLFGEKTYAEVLFAEEDKVKVGFALYFYNFSTFLGRPGIHLEDLFIQPKHRGKGYGKALLTHLARICVERGFGRLDWSVLDWNQPAIEFYNSIQAQPQPEWIPYRLSGEALKHLALT